MMKFSLVVVSVLLMSGCFAQKKDTEETNRRLEIIKREVSNLQTILYDIQKTSALTLAGHCKKPTKVAPKK